MKAFIVLSSLTSALLQGVFLSPYSVRISNPSYLVFWLGCSFQPVQGHSFHRFTKSTDKYPVQKEEIKLLAMITA